MNISTLHVGSSSPFPVTFTHPVIYNSFIISSLNFSFLIACWNEISYMSPPLELLTFVWHTELLESRSDTYIINDITEMRT